MADDAGPAVGTMSTTEPDFTVPVCHGIFTEGPRVAPLFGDAVHSCTLDPVKSCLWVLDSGCAQRMAGPLMGTEDDADIDPAIAKADLLTRQADDTASLAGIPGGTGFFSQSLFLPRWVQRCPTSTCSHQYQACHHLHGFLAHLIPRSITA